MPVVRSRPRVLSLLAAFFLFSALLVVQRPRCACRAFFGLLRASRKLLRTPRPPKPLRSNETLDEQSGGNFRRHDMQAWPATASWPSARFQRRRIHPRRVVLSETVLLLDGVS